MSARILVVDDHATNAWLIAEILEAQGHDVRTASNAEAAQPIIAEFRPQLILMDIGLPGMDGLTFTRLLKADPAMQGVKIAAITAAAMRGDEEKAIAAGCDAYITKPIDTRKLPETVLRLLGEPTAAAARTPALGGAPAASAATPVQAPARNAATPLSAGVLVVDDHANNRLLVREIVEAEGYVVHEAADGVEALNLLRTVQVVAVISDVLMPNMDGLTLCVEIRRQPAWRNIAVIIFTSTYNSATDRDLALKAGADAYLVKPAPAEQIRATIREARLSAASRAAPVTAGDEVVIVKQYNAALVAKLEERNAELSQMVDDLRTSERELRAVQERAHLGSWEIDVSTRRLRWSREMFRLFSYESAPAPDFATFFALIHPDDRLRVRDYYEAVLRAPAVPGQSVAFRTNPRRGAVRHLSTTVEAVRNDVGLAVTILGTTLDITPLTHAEESLREREAYYRLLLENVSDIITVLSADGTIEFQSASAGRILGYDTAETKGQSVFEFLHPDDVPGVKRAFAEGLERPGEAIRTEFRFRHHSAAWRIFESIGLCVQDDEQRVIIVNSRDVTESRALEEQFRQAQKMEAIGTLAGGIAHDFNNILAAIGGYTELARMKIGADSPIDHHLSAVLKATGRARDLVRQILAFSRQQEQERRPIAAWRAVDEALTLLRATIPAMIEFDIDLSHEARTILADPTQIHQVVMNLCTNAWHAMKGGTGRLTVTLANAEVDEALAARIQGVKPGTYVRLSVADTGSGMDETTLERIFEPFFTTKAPGEGTGLGLSVVHGIMQTHDGGITVESKPGAGTRFDLYFPAIENAAMETKAPVENIVRGQGERILYIDDEETLAVLSQQTLQWLGYTVQAETSPLRALDAIRQAGNAIDLVITDLAMPGLSGLELAAEIRRLRPGLPIILTTGYAPNLSGKNIGELGIAELVVKPPTAQRLAEAVHRVLAARRKVSVLLIDDDDAVRDAFSGALRERGYAVTEAPNGRAGVLAYTQEPTDVVITDLVMPEKEGLETIREIRAFNREARIIAISGGGRVSAVSYLQPAKQFGAKEILAKPFSIDDLVLAIERVRTR